MNSRQAALPKAFFFLTLGRFWGLVATFLIVAIPATAQTSERYLYSDSLLWQLQHPNGQHGYLFGTMHSPDRRLIPFVDHLRGYIEQADALYLEMTEPDLWRSFRASMSVVDDPLRNRLEPDVYRRLADYLSRHGIEDITLLQYLPILFVNALIYDPVGSDEETLDTRLETVAWLHGTATESLETVEERLWLVRSVEALDPNDAVTSALDDVELYDYESEMLDLYIAQDVNGLMEFVVFEECDASQFDWCDTIELYAQALEEDFAARNRAMASRIDEAMENGSVFAAMGVAHLPAEGGVLDLLVQRGFTVTPMHIPLQQSFITTGLVIRIIICALLLILLKNTIFPRTGRQAHGTETPPPSQPRL